MTTTWHIPSSLRSSFEEIELVWNYQKNSSTWRVVEGNVTSYLKIGSLEMEPEFLREQAGMNLLQHVLHVPTVMRVGNSGTVCWLQTKSIDGTDLSRMVHEKDAEWIVKQMASALYHFHQTPIALPLIDVYTQFQRDWRKGKTADKQTSDLLVQIQNRPTSPVLLHGDFCLPNILYCEKTEQIGYVDLGGLCMGSREYDIAIGLHSLALNLGNSYESMLLSSYPAPIDTELLALWKQLIN